MPCSRCCMSPFEGGQLDSWFTISKEDYANHHRSSSPRFWYADYCNGSGREALVRRKRLMDTVSLSRIYVQSIVPSNRIEPQCLENQQRTISGGARAYDRPSIGYHRDEIKTLTVNQYIISDGLNLVDERVPVWQHCMMMGLIRSHQIQCCLLLLGRFRDIRRRLLDFCFQESAPWSSVITTGDMHRKRLIVRGGPFCI